MAVNRLASKYRMPIFLALVVVVAIVLLTFSMRIYYTSGAYQLDLSRPEYKGVRSKITKNNGQNGAFSAQGEISDKVLEDFLKRYKKEATEIRDAKPFQGDVLDDEQLGL